jgi:adenylate cyclase
MIRKLAAGLAIGAGSAAIVLAIAVGGWLETFELASYDWRMRLAAADPPDVHPDIVVVELNDTTIRDLEPVFGRWPWPRAAFSMVIDFLNRGPAKVIAVDFTFTERDTVKLHQIGTAEISGLDSDAVLVEAVEAAPSTILLADATYEGVRDGDVQNVPAEWKAQPFRLGPAIYPRPTIITPIPELTVAASSVAHNYAVLDKRGSLRRIPPFVRVDDRFMPSLGVAAALRAADIRPEEVVLEGRTLRVRDRGIPLLSTHVRDAVDPDQYHEQLTMLVNYRGPAVRPNGERPYPTYEIRHLIDAELRLLSGDTPPLDPDIFRDKIVFVGLTAAGLVDIFQTPFDAQGQGRMPGVQMHASVADSILSNRFIRPASNATRVGVVLGTALLIGLLAAFFSFTVAMPIALLLMAGWTAWSLTVFGSGSWMPMAEPLSAMALALFGGTAYQYFVEGREKRKVKTLFGRYVSRDVFSQLMTHPERAELGGARRDMSVLFSDIRGFTAVTERGDPEALVAQLNEYFSRMVDIVFRHRGTVDKFVGDMVMALFGAPLDDPDHAENAVRTAVEMVEALGHLNRKWADNGQAQLDIGIGVNSGEMIAGNIGSSSIMSYTVIGDNVNLAARLESLNKDYRTRVIISDATRVRLSGGYEIDPLGDVVVKGKTRPVAIFEVKVPSPLLTVSESENV